MSGSVPGKLQDVEGGPHVQAGPAGEDGPLAAAVDVGDGRPCLLLEVGHRLASSVTSRMSSRWCGTPLRSASVILAVPMSMPR